MGSFFIWALVYLCLGFGILGCFINKVPGPIAVLVAVLFAKFGLDVNFGWETIAIVAALAIGSMYLSKVVKSATNKVQEFSKRASWGTTIGSIIGLCTISSAADSDSIASFILMAVLGLVIIPFVFAYLFEITNKEGNGTVMKRATAATTVYLVDTLLTLIVFAYAIYVLFR